MTVVAKIHENIDAQNCSAGTDLTLDMAIRLTNCSSSNLLLSFFQLLKKFWLSDSNANINLPQFIQELATQAACTNTPVRESLSSKVAKSRLSKEESALSRLKVGSVVLRRVPGFNKCLESSWDGPFTITKLIHPVNCQIRDVEKKSKPVVVHVSQLKLVISLFLELFPLSRRDVFS